MEMRKLLFGIKNTNKFENKSAKIASSKLDFLIVGSNSVLTMSWVSGTMKVAPENVIPLGPTADDLSWSVESTMALVECVETVDFVCVVDVIGKPKKWKICNAGGRSVCEALGRMTMLLCVRRKEEGESAAP
jgi:hypothetical protein